MDKPTKRGKSKKKKSHRRKHEKEKISTSPDIDLSDQDMNDFDPSCQRKGSTAFVQSGETHPNSSLLSKKQAQIQLPPSVLQLQPQAIGYGENLKIIPAKVVPSTTSVLPTRKTKTVNGSVSSKPPDSDARMKKSASQSSVLSSKISKSSIANVDMTKLQARADMNNESLRWENECSNSDDEAERIKQYKLNRRKRYLAAANKKYSDWLKTLQELEHISGRNSARQEKDFSRHNSSSSYSLPPQKEGLVSGLAPQMSLHNTATQVLLNC